MTLRRDLPLYRRMNRVTTAPTVLTSPVATGALPSAASVLGGTTITISGGGFLGVNVVLFGAVPGTSISVAGSGNSLTVVAPVNLPGTYDVTVISTTGISVLKGKVTYS